MHSLKVAVKIIIGFLFSLTVLLTFLTLSLFGVKAEDTIRLIVTEATGLRRDMVVFYADLQPMVIHNVFWLCLASLGFMLIVLYFIDHSFSGFMGPGVLCLAITAFLTFILIASLDNILLFTGVVSQLYIQTALDRFREAAIGIASFGILLVALSIWGDRIFKKKK
ncbi:MAG: hypothetical protein SCJ97_09960 [Bacillota bacterium]|nr:hypothetical protein [Bacillota bacterium]